VQDIKNSGIRKEEDAISVADVATIKNMKLDKNVSKMYQTLKRRDMIRQEEFKSQASKSMAYGADMSEVSMHFEDQSENANYFVPPEHMIKPIFSTSSCSNRGKTKKTTTN
jgi:hypothetical protein